MAKLSAQQLQRLWVKAGGDPSVAPMMAKIALRESGGRPSINNAGLNKNGSVDYGLWQINSVHGYDPNKLYNPRFNAKAAVEVYAKQGPKAWATYNAAIDRKYIGTGHNSKVMNVGKTKAKTARSRSSTSPNTQLALSLLGVSNAYGVDPLDLAIQAALQKGSTRSDVRGSKPSAPPTRPLGHVTPGSPVPGQKPHSATHQTAGLPGYPAYDYMAKAGTPVVAPVSGKVVKLSGHDPKLGAVQGAGGPLGWSVYIQGKDGRTYYLTHLGSRNVKQGQRVKAGQQIGSVADYDKYGRPSHVHEGVRG